MSKGSILTCACISSLGLTIALAIHLSTFFLRISFVEVFAASMVPLQLGSILLFIPSIRAMIYLNRTRLGWRHFYRKYSKIMIPIVATCFIYTVATFLFSFAASPAKGSPINEMARAMRTFSGFWMFFFLASSWPLWTYYVAVWGKRNRDLDDEKPQSNQLA
jgi:hypothetical protein